MRKIVGRVILAVLLLLIAAAIIVWLAIDFFAEAAVEKGATYALGVKTELDSMDVRLLRGEVTMEGLNVANPEGFDTPHLMHSGRFELGVRTGSLFSDTVEVRKFHLDGLDVNVEQKLTGSNVSKVLQNLERVAGQEKDREPPSEGRGKKVKVDHILIKDVKAHFHILGGIASKPRTITVEVPQIELRQVSSDEGGVVVAELVRRLLPAILKAVIKEGKGTVPGDLLRELDGQVSTAIAALGGEAGKLVEQVDKTFGKTVGDRVRELTDKVFGEQDKPQ